MEPQPLSAQEVQDCLELNPFDGDFGEPGDKIFSDRICIARKPAACGECDEAIAPGAQQRRLEAIFDGEWRCYRWCLACCRAQAASWRDDGAALEARAALRRERCA